MKISTIHGHQKMPWRCLPALLDNRNRLPESPSVDTAWPGGYSRMMEIGYDPAKRDKPLKERGLDFEDTRKDYDERRWVTIGFLSGRMVVVGWPPGTRFGEFSQ